MKHPKPSLPAALALLTLTGCAAQGSHHTRANDAPAASNDQDGWTSLFDGTTLSGWTQRNGHASYTVSDGVILGETRPNTGNSFLCTNRDYADFVLELDLKCDDELNSGVQIRSHSSPDYNNGQVYGYQVEVDPSPRGYSGGLYDEGNRGWLAEPTPAQAKATPFRNNEWNHYRVEARGPRIRTWINGVPVADLQDDLVANGFIALQVHTVGNRTDPLHVSWRNIRIRELH
ncbi:MAG: DUF1080 domain-containing protein [Phycisphaerales bacterium]|nr:DUF1080 domain-containing protein [Phycisphaerales bacterium]